MEQVSGGDGQQSPGRSRRDETGGVPGCSGRLYASPGRLPKRKTSDARRYRESFMAAKVESPAAETGTALDTGRSGACGAERPLKLLRRFCPLLV